MHGHQKFDRCDECADWPAWAVEINARLIDLEIYMTEFSSEQAHLDADVSGLKAAFAQEIALLKNQTGSGQLDFSGVDALLANEQAEVVTDTPAQPAPPVVTPPADGGDSSTPSA